MELNEQYHKRDSRRKCAGNSFEYHPSTNSSSFSECVERSKSQHRSKSAELLRGPHVGLALSVEQQAILHPIQVPVLAFDQSQSQLFLPDPSVPTEPSKALESNNLSPIAGNTRPEYPMPEKSPSIENIESVDQDKEDHKVPASYGNHDGHPATQDTSHEGVPVQQQEDATDEHQQPNGRYGKGTTNKVAPIPAEEADSKRRFRPHPNHHEIPDAVLVSPHIRTRFHGRQETGIFSMKRRITHFINIAAELCFGDEDQRNLKAIWNRMDVDGDGMVDYQEFCETICELLDQVEAQKLPDNSQITDNPENIRANTTQMKSQSEDRRHSSTNTRPLTELDYRLIYFFQREIRLSGSLQKTMETWFERFDLNHSGKISHMEFLDGVRELGILNYNIEVHGKKRRYADTSLFVLKIDNRFRYALIWFVEWKWFDRFVLVCIIINSIILAIRDPQDPGAIPDLAGNLNLNLRNQIVEKSEAVFTSIFSIECGLKIIAMGFIIGNGAYLRSSWNVLDFFVVFFALIGDLPGVPKLSSLRTCRVLRPLRTLTSLRGMRMLVNSLFTSIPALLNVMAILAFVFTIFGIMGMMFWSGILNYRCRATPEPVDGVWKLAGEGRVCGGHYACAPGETCGSVYDLPSNTSYVNMSELSSSELWDYKLVNFDNMGFAMLTLFQCITLEGWTSVMYNFQDTQGFVFPAVYFVLFTIIGAFFLIQFVFAVIWQRFNAANDGVAGEWDVVVEEVKMKQLQQERIARRALRLGKAISMRQLKEKFRKSIHRSVIFIQESSSWKRIQRICCKIINNNRFGSFIVLCILINTACLAMDEYPMDPNRDIVTENLNLLLTIIFFGEMILKLLGLGIIKYLQDRYNVFDGIVVLISISELIMALAQSDTIITTSATSKRGTSSFTALRAFRLFRIMKLARSWKSLRDLLSTIANSVADVANFGLLLFLMMYVFALIGMQFFANKYHFDDNGNYVEWQPHIYNYTTPLHAPWTKERPYTIRRSNFDDSLSAFLAVFQCLTEESWNLIMADAVRSTGLSAVIFFLAVMVIGNIVVLNLFLAILLGNFSMDSQKEENESALTQGNAKIADFERSASIRRNSVLRNSVTPQWNLRDFLDQIEAKGSNDCHPNPPHKMKSEEDSESIGLSSSSQRFHSRPEIKLNQVVPCNDAPKPIPKEKGSSTRRVSTSNESKIENSSEEVHKLRRMPTKRLRRSTSATGSSSDLVEPTTLVGKILHFNPVPKHSLFILSDKNAFRVLVKRMVKSVYFESMMLLVITLSSIELAVDNPLNDPDSDLSNLVESFDRVFTILFFIEMVLKVISCGFLINGSKSYLRDSWNLLDFVILCSSLATFFSSSNALRSLRAFRTLRALRPLRMISRVPGMKRVVNALLSSIPCIFNVFLVCILVYLIFGIIGTNFFKGKMFYCDMSSLSPEQQQLLEDTFGFTSLSFKKLMSKDDCINAGGVWSKYNRNYDNVLKSAMTLFELSTTEGWNNIMFQGVDATEIDHHPVVNYRRGYAIFFVVFIIVGAFFTLNLFVGAVIDNFNRMRDSMGGIHASNETQREWLQIQEFMKTIKLNESVEPPDNWFRAKCFSLSQHPFFEGFVVVCVILNTLILALHHFGESDQVKKAFDYLNIVFWAIFLVEATVKIIALGRNYFFNSWNRFDFAVMLGSTVTVVMPLIKRNGKVSPVVTSLRAFRMGLAIRLMKRAKSMQDIVNTILENMPALVNVSTLLFLILFVYAVMGIQIFAGVMLGDSLTEHANFRNIYYAMLTLFRFTTGEAWNDVMYDLMVVPIDGEQPFPYGKSCNANYNYTELVAARNYTGNPELTIGCTPGIVVTYIYFVTFMLLTTYVLVNLFVAVILEGFEETTEKNASAITIEDLQHLADLWQEYDHKATGFVTSHDFLKLLREVPPPLGLPSSAKRREVDQLAKALGLVVQDGRIAFVPFMITLSQNEMLRIAEERGEPIVRAKVTDVMLAKGIKAMKTRRSSMKIVSLVVYISAMRIQARVRTHIAKTKFASLRSELLQKRKQEKEEANATKAHMDGHSARTTRTNSVTSPFSTRRTSESSGTDNSSAKPSAQREQEPSSVHHQEPLASVDINNCDNDNTNQGSNSTESNHSYHNGNSRGNNSGDDADNAGEASSVGTHRAQDPNG